MTRFPSRASGLVMIPVNAAAGLWRLGLRLLRGRSAKDDLAALSLDNDPVADVRAALVLARRGDAHVRQAVDARFRVMSSRAVELLVAALDTDDMGDAETRRDVAEALTRNGSEMALRGLLERGDRQARIGAMRKLGATPRPSDATARLIVSAMSDPDTAARQAAIEVAEKIAAKTPARAITEALLESLSDDEPEVRWRAARALGAVGGEGVVDALSRAQSDSDDYVREQAKRARERLRSND